MTIWPAKSSSCRTCSAAPTRTTTCRSSVINEFAWHNLFVHQLFIRPTAEELKSHKPEFTIVSAPGFLADPKRDGTSSEVFVMINFTKKLVLIGGTQYAGEMKKSIFSIMNFLLPQRERLPYALLRQYRDKMA